MESIRVIVVDDEPAAISNLKWELENFCKDVEVIESFTSPREAISGINYLKPDCVFLDIEMPEKDGFTLLSELTFKGFQLIITTAYENYALKAFKENAIDYLLKPIDSDELIHAVEKGIASSKRGTQHWTRAVLAAVREFQKHRCSIPLLSTHRSAYHSRRIHPGSRP